MFPKLSILIALACLLVVSSFAQTREGAYHVMLKGLYTDAVPVIAAEALHQKLSKQKAGVVLLDTRTKIEFEVSHLKGSRFVDYDSFSIEQIQDLPKDASIVVYCSVGYRSEKIGEKLKNAGYRNVYNLYGGIFEWVNKGFTVYDAKGITSKVHAYSPAWGVWLAKGEKVYE
ncbi:rhodanese-like domain-containing protein [Pontibacter sp. H249]|uniref:rhodanese-like domain-containing protein n=1 Tax=Pontibacter sp. H249 TaxID=3133420 RepID=UPI0030BD04B6